MSDKYWNELNTEEKLEALREQVEQLTYYTGRLAFAAERLLQHSHADGKIVAPINQLDRHDRHEGHLPMSLQTTQESEV